jgi:hypothetical protein
MRFRGFERPVRYGLAAAMLALAATLTPLTHAAPFADRHPDATTTMDHPIVIQQPVRFEAVTPQDSGPAGLRDASSPNARPPARRPVGERAVLHTRQ